MGRTIYMDVSSKIFSEILNHNSLVNINKYFKKMYFTHQLIRETVSH